MFVALLGALAQRNFLEALGLLVLVYGAERLKTAAMSIVSDYLLNGDLARLGAGTDMAKLIVGESGPTRYVYIVNIYIYIFMYFGINGIYC